MSRPRLPLSCPVFSCIIEKNRPRNRRLRHFKAHFMACNGAKGYALVIENANPKT